MSDDLVTRLRDAHKSLVGGWTVGSLPLNEAIARIEAQDEELVALRTYCRDIRETALDIGGIDHTTDAPTMLRSLGARIEMLEATLAAIDALHKTVDDAGIQVCKACALIAPCPTHRLLHPEKEPT